MYNPEHLPLTRFRSRREQPDYNPIMKCLDPESTEEHFYQNISDGPVNKLKTVVSVSQQSILSSAKTLC